MALTVSHRPYHKGLTLLTLLTPWQCLTTADRGVIMGSEPWDDGVTGIITTDGLSTARGFQYARCGVPVVMLDPSPAILATRPLADLPHVRRDSRAIGALAASYYLERGYKSFAWVGEPEGWYWSAERREGYEAALAAAGFRCAALEPSAAGRGAAAARTRMNQIDRFLRPLPKPVALFAANDAQGRRILNVCANAGLSVPEQVAVLGVDDDILLCESTVPSLSSIRTGDYRCGQIAAAMLDDLMHGRPVAEPSVVLAPLGVVTCGSTGYEAMDNPTLARAVGFIRERAPGGAVEAAGCSRRYLERLFRARLGRSVHEEVVRERLERIKRLLETETAPIGDVIGIAGFSGGKRLSALFKRMTGTTMREWRRRHSDRTLR